MLTRGPQKEEFFHVKGSKVTGKKKRASPEVHPKAEGVMRRTTPIHAWLGRLWPLARSFPKPRRVG